jgi:hypothetical protein
LRGAQGVAEAPILGFSPIMPLDLLPIVRVILLIAAVTAVLQATVLNGWIQRAIFNRLASFGQPASARRFPDPRMARVFPLFMALVFLAVWWYLGTAGGVNWVRDHFGRHP